MVKKIGAGIGKWPSRSEGWWRIFNSLKDKSGTRANILDSINYVEQKMVFRTIEAGSGLTIEILDAEKNKHDTPFTYLRLSSTVQEGVNITRNGTPVGTGPATTLNFTGGVTTFETSPGNITVSVTGGDGTFIDIQEDGVTKNSRPTNIINFVSGFSITETVSGQVNVSYTGLAGIEVSENGVPAGSVTSIDFVGVSGSVTNTGPGSISVNLSNTTGYSEITPFTYIYSGSTVISGEAIVSGFFGSQTPDETDVVIAINGLVLEYNSDINFSDFTVNNSDLVINISNLGFPLEPDDKIKGYYWVSV